MSAPRRPNILWVSFEDTNPFYGCYGDPVARTPNVDRLAAEGCRWPRAYSTAGVCAPARSAVITGMYPTSIGTHHMRTTHRNRATPEMATPYSAVIPHYVKCFPEYLRAAGYFCTNCDKTDYQFDPPVTMWDEQGRHAHWRNRPDPDQPFFAVFNLTRSHESGMWEEAKVEPTVDPGAIRLPPYFPDTPKVRRSMAKMYANIEFNDGITGDLLSQLEEDGLAENTIVVNWSDHGPLPRGKRWPYDSGIHVPLIARWPGHLKPGTVSDRLVSTVDLGPTMLSIAGVPIPRHVQGRAFLGAQETAPREYVFASRDRHDEAYDMVRAVRDKRFKYLRNVTPEIPYVPWIPYLNRHPIMQEWQRLRRAGALEGDQDIMFRPRPPEELYDTRADPHELRNLAGDPAYAGELERLRGALDEWRRETGDLGDLPETEMVRRWYPDGGRPATAKPVMIPLGDDAPGVEAAAEGGTFTGPLDVQLHCPTQGASIAYTLEEGGNPRWRLYTGPVRLDRGTSTIRAKAIRIGYLESEEAAARFEVTGDR